MAKKKRMPVNVLAEQEAAVEAGSAVDEIVAGRAASALEPEASTEASAESASPVALPADTVEGQPREPAPAVQPPRPIAPLPPAQRARPDAEQRLRRSEDALGKRVLLSAVVGLLPWPFLALILLTGLNVATVHALAEEYRVPFHRDFPKALVAAFLSAVLAGVVGRAGGEVLGYLPFAGPLLGVVFRACAAAASTYLLAQLFLRNHEAGGTLLVRDPRATGEYFRKKFQGGKGES